MPEALIHSIPGIQGSAIDGLPAWVVLAPEGSGPTGKRVRALRLLVVEDDYFTAVQNQTALEQAGYEVVGMAGSFAEALRLAEAERPDLVVMDIRLVGAKDGVDAATEIMSRLSIPSLFVSAFTDEATRRRAAPAQPLGWLTKPFTVEQLVEGVRIAAERLSSPKQ
jgi:two-component system, response regulator PdtaR